MSQSKSKLERHERLWRILFTVLWSTFRELIKNRFFSTNELGVVIAKEWHNILETEVNSLVTSTKDLMFDFV